MLTAKKIKIEISDLENLDSMIAAYEEIAATRMRRVKNSVLHNREFLNGLTDVFARVKNTYKKEVEKLVARKDTKSMKSSLIVSKGRTAAVFLASNTGLYGDIISKTFSDFIRYITTNDVDPVVIGRLGRRLMAHSVYKKEFKFFELSDSVVNDAKVSEIVEFIRKYEHILVFHGKFKDILNQIPARTYVTGQDLTTKVTVQSSEVKSIFEPSLEELLGFFETQILSTLFDQTLYESALSKFTSRMISLDTASSNINNRLSMVLLQRSKLKHMAYNKQQSNMLASVSLWGGAA